MGPRAEMKVRLRDLPIHKHITLACEFVREAIAGMPLRVALERPADDPDAGAAEADLDLTVEREHVFVRGDLRGWMEVACSRCVGPVRVEVDEALVVTYVRADAVPAEDMDDVEVTADDSDLYTFEDDVIDLEPLLREQLVLALPYAPLCSEDCKGLCSQCGADLNHTTCNCNRQVRDPRLAALETVKLRDAVKERK